jgi:hypothetical protein
VRCCQRCKHLGDGTARRGALANRPTHRQAEPYRHALPALLCRRERRRHLGDCAPRLNGRGRQPGNAEREQAKEAKRERPYSERRAQLEALDLNGIYRQTPETFDDGDALFEAVCAHELEGVCRETTEQPLPAWRAWLGQDQEQKLLALGNGARERDQQAAREAVRLTTRS